MNEPLKIEYEVVDITRLSDDDRDVSMTKVNETILVRRHTFAGKKLSADVRAATFQDESEGKLFLAWLQSRGFKL